MEELIADELKFYSKFTKALILNLPNWKDRVLAATWVKKIIDESAGTESLRLIYLKLLLFSLQRRRLVGIFADDPSRYEELEAIPEGFDLNDIAKNLLEVEFAERQDRIRQQLRGQTGTFPPYMTDCSSDFREYVAVQDIPGFGVHGYYAISKEPVNTWNRSERGIFPKLARSAVDATTPLVGDTSIAPAGASGDPTCLCVEAEEDKDPECKCEKKVTLPPAPKKKRVSKFGKTPPISPIGAVSRIADERTPPTWGSNLTQVRDESNKSESGSEESLQQEVFGLTDALGGFEQFVDEYKRGAMDKNSKIAGKRIVVPPGQAKGSQGGQLGDDDNDEDDEMGQDLDSSRRIEEIKEDSHLISYYRGILNQTATQKEMAKANQDKITSAPARTGIPLTTPKSAPSPKRPVASERLYADETVVVDKAAEGQAMPLEQEDSEDKIEKVYPTDDEFTVWTKRLKAVEKTCEINLSQLDASQQVDKSVSLGRKGVSKQDEACGPGRCGAPCE